jgi:hypothetical protein
MMAGNFGACICLKGKTAEVGDAEALGYISPALLFKFKVVKISHN